MIFCDYTYCIYNKRRECTLKTISISAAGLCDDCIIPYIDEETMDKIKMATLADMEIRTIKKKGQKKKAPSKN